MSIERDYGLGEKFDVRCGISYYPNLTPEDCEFRLYSGVTVYDIMQALLQEFHGAKRENRRIEFISFYFNRPKAVYENIDSMSNEEKSSI